MKKVDIKNIIKLFFVLLPVSIISISYLLKGLDMSSRTREISTTYWETINFMAFIVYLAIFIFIFFSRKKWSLSEFMLWFSSSAFFTFFSRAIIDFLVIGILIVLFFVMSFIGGGSI